MLIQTSDTNHAVLKAIASGNRDAFYAAEWGKREAAGLPPFGRMAALIARGIVRREQVVTHEFPLDRVVEAVRSLLGMNPPGGGTGDGPRDGGPTAGGSSGGWSPTRS